MGGVTKAAVATVVLLCAAPCAQASRLTQDVDVGPDGSEFYVYKAAPGERNHVSVRITEDRLTIVDRGARRIALGDTSCHHTDPQRVVCETYPIDVYLGDRSDTIGFIPGDDEPDAEHRNPVYLEQDYEEPIHSYTTFVDAGAGNDRITGSKRTDEVQPGPGRDIVDTRAGDDSVFLRSDGARDRIMTGGGIDDVSFGALRKPVHVDLGKGSGGGDRLEGVERVFGTDQGDTLIGSAHGDALYGEGGVDHLYGGAGNDLLDGEHLGATSGSGNDFAGGTGNDVIDARGGPTTSVDCGTGTDTLLGEDDDLLDPNCELAGFRTDIGEYYFSGYSRFGRIKARPLRVAPDGTPTFEVGCPDSESFPDPNCKGTLALERPPGGEPEDYGSGSFDLESQHRGEVTVALTPAGRSAIAAHEPVGVDVTGDLGDEKIDFGWQLVLPPPSG